MRFSVACGLAAFLACPVFGCTPTDGLDDRPHHTIDLGSVAIDARALEPISAEATRAPDGSGQYVIVQLDGPATTAQLESLAASVDQVYGYLPQDSFLVRVAPGQAPPSLGGWAGVYRPEYKIARALRDAAESPAAGADGAMETIMVQAFPDADLDRVAGDVGLLPEAELVGAGTGARFSRLRLRVPADRAVAVAEALAELPEIFWIDVEGQRALFNDTTIWVGQSGVSGGQATPVFDQGIHGEGQVIGFIDTGLDVDSCFFRDTERGLPPQNVCDGGTLVDPDQRKVIATDFLWATECAGGIAGTEYDPAASHGTHVGGIIAGDNFVRPIVHDTADGMAPGAKLVVQDAGSGTDACGSMPGIGCPVVDIKPFFQQAYSQGARLHSNSWGDQQNTIPHNRYTAASEDVDDFMWTHPDFLIFFAAGNAGSNPGTVFSPSTAKNGISVGATQHAASAELMAVFSGCGPTADNRIKPDLTIPGSLVVSARSDGNVASNNCTTVTLSGTSQATPGAAGLGALVRQYYTDGFYPSGAAVPSDGFAPSAALVKATLLNSARQMTGVGAGTIPANCQGWGRILLDDGLFFAGQTRRLVAVDDPGFAQGGAGEQKKLTFIVRENESLKATLVWTDFPSTPAASVNLVNDLDLEVSGPAGTFLGNVFTGGLSQTGGAADRRNTVEQVLLATPGAGIYTVTVRAFNVPVGPQPFALIVAGDATLNQPPVADAGPDLTGQAGVEVLLDGSASSDPDGAPSPLTLAWSQTGGPAVTLAGADAPQASFTPTALGTYTFRLLVSDGAEERDDTVSVTIANQPPVADAGADQSGRAGTQVLLDGSASNDPDDLPSPLTFAWTQTGGPAVTLAGADAALASFTPAALGTYTFRLVVSDGAAQAEDTVAVTVVNLPPVANAGPDRSGRPGDLIQLDGSASSDPDGVPSPLSFAWSQTGGPAVTLAGADASLASFTPTALGTYTFRLVVSDGAAEAEDTVTVTLANLSPIASAGPDRTGHVGDQVQLDGSASSDPDGVPSPLTFAWTQTSGPAVTLAGADSALAGFAPIALGTYTFRLLVSDGAAEAEDTVTVTILNLPPIANAGPDRSGLAAVEVLLDGSGSSDPDGVPSPLTFAWTQTDGPPATLLGSDVAQALFTPTALGTYTFRLLVSDGAEEAADTVTITILNQAPIADAGPDLIGLIGFPVLLDGTGSRDPDGLPLPLSFAWTQTGGPPAILVGAGTAQAVFTPTALGSYTFSLVVGDGAGQGDDSVTVTILNQAPVANAGPDETGLIGHPILLDGAGSTDPDGGPLPLSFAWTQTEGPPATLVGADAVLATFTPTAIGTYTFRLLVSDGGGEDDDTVIVTILDQAPTADAGPDQTGRAGVPILLDGAGSTDPDGVPLPLSFAWTQTEGPPVTLVEAETVAATFIANALGTYTFRLVVSDGAAEDDDTVTVTILNLAPVADAGADHTGLAGVPVLLDGTGSGDPDGLPLLLSFAWTQTAGPTVTILGANLAEASFVPAQSGTYTFSVVVSDGAAQDDDTVTVTVTAANSVVFFDDFETSLGWTVNPLNTDTAVTGRWERGAAQATSNAGLPMQLTALSGTSDLVTAAAAGATVGDNDIDGGSTSIQSPAIALPIGQITLSFSYYLAHLTNSSSADFLRVRIVGLTTVTVLQELGAATNDGAAWQSASINISAFAGQIVRIRIEASDASTASLVEAAVDDVKIESLL